MTEKRSFARVEKQFLISYEVLKADESVAQEGIARDTDLSIEGLHLELPTMPRIGDKMRLTVALEDQLVKLSGSVVWVEPGDDLNQVGFRLTQIPPEYRTKLREWLS